MWAGPAAEGSIGRSSWPVWVEVILVPFGMVAVIPYVDRSLLASGVSVSYTHLTLPTICSV